MNNRLKTARKDTLMFLDVKNLAKVSYAEYNRVKEFPEETLYEKASSGKDWDSFKDDYFDFIESYIREIVFDKIERVVIFKKIFITTEEVTDPNRKASMDIYDSIYKHIYKSLDKRLGNESEVLKVEYSAKTKDLESGIGKAAMLNEYTSSERILIRELMHEVTMSWFD